MRCSVRRGGVQLEGKVFCSVSLLRGIFEGDLFFLFILSWKRRESWFVMDDFDGFLESNGFEGMVQFVEEAHFGTGEVFEDEFREDGKEDLVGGDGGEEELFGGGEGGTSFLNDEGEGERVGEGMEEGDGRDIQVLKRKTSMSRGQEMIKRAAVEVERRELLVERGMRGKAEELPTSMVSDSSAEERTEKKMGNLAVLSTATPQITMPRMVRLVVNKDLAPESVDAELNKPVQFPAAEEIRAALSSFNETVRFNEALDRMPKRPSSADTVFILGQVLPLKQRI